MAKAKKKLYAVLVGHKPGIYLTWDECQAQTKGFSGAKFKSFDNSEDAHEYMKGKVVVTSKEEKKADYLKKAKEAEEMAIRVSKEPGVVAIYTDGSSKKKPVTEEIVFGYGVAIIDNGVVSHSFGGANDHPTYAKYANVAGEVMGAIEALKWVKNNQPDVKKIVLIYDYEGIGYWADNSWKAKNIMTQRYVEFLDEYVMDNGIKIEFRHVKGHVGNPFNELVDDIAGKAIDAFLERLAKLSR
ncbi:ribonuclease H1 domain-containing protein [Rossellomorea marisflavi]|uniref:ribonuclease H1 domain-containing protein n=1 Tax=Rossellomorea marisflavi TaxID=189381 RepID=UPI003FA13035